QPGVLPVLLALLRAAGARLRLAGARAVHRRRPGRVAGLVVAVAGADRGGAGHRQVPAAGLPAGRDLRADPAQGRRGEHRPPRPPPRRGGLTGPERAHPGPRRLRARRPRDAGRDGGAETGAERAEGRRPGHPSFSARNSAATGARGWSSSSPLPVSTCTWNTRESTASSGTRKLTMKLAFSPGGSGSPSESAQPPRPGVRAPASVSAVRKAKEVSGCHTRPRASSARKSQLSSFFAA